MSLNKYLNKTIYLEGKETTVRQAIKKLKTKGKSLRYIDQYMRIAILNPEFEDKRAV